MMVKNLEHGGVDRVRDSVTKHYEGEGGLGDRLEAQLSSLGLDERLLSPQDTAARLPMHPKDTGSRSKCP
jgi:hypothetical protein